MGRGPGVEPGTKDPQSPSLTNTSLASPSHIKLAGH